MSKSFRTHVKLDNNLIFVFRKELKKASTNVLSQSLGIHS